MSKLLLIDANSLIFRAYYATAYGNMMVSKSGQPTNALFGFTNMILKALTMIQPTHVLFAFDAKAKTFRHEQYQEPTRRNSHCICWEMLTVQRNV